MKKIDNKTTSTRPSKNMVTPHGITIVPSPGRQQHRKSYPASTNQPQNSSVALDTISSTQTKNKSSSRSPLKGREGKGRGLLNSQPTFSEPLAATKGRKEPSSQETRTANNTAGPLVVLASRGFPLLSRHYHPQRRLETAGRKLATARRRGPSPPDLARPEDGRHQLEKTTDHPRNSPNPLLLVLLVLPTTSPRQSVKT